MTSSAPVTVSLEAYPYHGGTQRDKAVHHLLNGQVVYEEPKTPAQQLSSAVEVLFRDSRGKFKELTVENLAKRPEDDPFLLKEAEATVRDGAVDEEKEEDVEEKEATMSFTEMVQLKQELSDEMGQAWNKLNAVVSLCRDLLPPEKAARPPAPPPVPHLLPPGSLGVTNVPRPTVLRHNLIHASRQAVTRNRRGIVEAQRALQAAAGRMRSRAEQDRAFWDGVGALSVGERKWDVGPAWTHDVGVLKADRQMAKDVMVLYAPDEADPTLRLHCKATLPQSNTKDTTDRLAFTLRKKRRLQVSLTTSEGEVSRSILDSQPAEDEADLRDILDAAQAEAFDEEIFAALQNEADQRADLDARISVGKVTVQAGPSMELAFEMIETDDIDSDVDRPRSGLASLLACIMRLLQISIYRHRRLIEAFAKMRNTPALRKRIPMPTTTAPSGALAMIVPFLAYQTFCGQFKRLLTDLQDKVAAIGVKLSVDWSGGGDAAGLNWDALLHWSDKQQDQEKVDFQGSSVEMTVEGRQLCSLLIARDCSVSLMLPRAMINLSDTALLPSMLAAEAQRCVLDILRVRLGKSGPCNVDYHRGAVANEQTMIIISLEDETLTLRAERRRRSAPAGPDQSSTARPAHLERYLPASGQNLLDWAMS